MIGCTTESENDIVPLAGAQEGSNTAENSNDVEYEMYSDKFEDINPENDTNMVVHYPQIKNFRDKNREKVINKLIEWSAIGGYWTYGSNKGRSLDIDYKVTLATEQLLSVQFSGLMYLKGTAHPNKEFYTINIYLENGEIIDVSDFVDFGNEELLAANVFEFASGSMQPDGEISDVLKEHIGSVHSYYLTPERLGVAVYVNFASGGHWEFEASYDDLKNYVKTYNPSWENPLRALIFETEE